jgi:hypothetical protein
MKHIQTTNTKPKQLRNNINSSAFTTLGHQFCVTLLEASLVISGLSSAKSHPTFFSE